MFSLQKLLSKDDMFYDLLEASAGEAERSVQALNKVLASPDKLPSLQEFHGPKEADKRITERINTALVGAFVTQLEREDIELLSAVLYKIPKTVEKFVERLMISAHVAKHHDFSRHAHLLNSSTQQVSSMVQQLRRPPTVGRIKEMDATLEQIEKESDALLLSLYKDLYNNAHPANKVLAMKDLFDLLEKILSRCREAGAMVTQIVLKHA
ncbi:MAG: DUF47 family protein [Verrucomicrobia bacterium]|nr:DUF47 family protein [Verrucomicrobiota bacterium]MBI3868805.1 DUF47 family protein [Verrucomicrobiota bacterium]